MSERAFLNILVSSIVVLYCSHCVYVRNLNSLLKAIQPENRRIAPVQVYVLLLLIVNLVIDFQNTESLRQLQSDMKRIVFTVISWIVFLLLQLWQYKIVSSIADSIELEYRSRSLPVRRRPTFYVGLCMVIASGVSVFNLFPNDDFLYGLGKLGTLAYLITWIIYWVQTHRYKKKIKAMPTSEQIESPIFSNLY